MPLTFDFSAVRDHKTVTTHPTDPEVYHPVADALIWLSMICGYGEITEKNVEKIIERIMQYQAVRGAFLRGGKGAENKIYIMPTDVKRFIGMRSNASTLSDAEWRRKLVLLVTEAATDLAAERRPSALDAVALLQPV